MKTTTRKIMSRIGAGLMLGLSLFNLAAAWNKQGSELPKRAKQIRRKELEQIKPETQMIAQVAEQEGKTVIAQLEQQETVQLETPKLTTTQIMIRGAAVVVWGVTASVFFSSMIFNQPIALGKFALSLLPGVPHTSTLSLQPQMQSVEADNFIAMDLVVDSNGELINLVNAPIQYDVSQIKFDHYQTKENSFDQTKIISSVDGDLIVLLQQEKVGKVFRQQAVVTLFFQPLVKEGTVEMQINQAQALVLKRVNEENHNVLGKVADQKVWITSPSKQEISCPKLDFDATQQENWRQLVQKNQPVQMVPDWTAIDEQRGWLCRQDEAQVYLLYLGQENDQLKISTNYPAKTITQTDSLFSWQAATQEVGVFSVKKQSQLNLKIQLSYSGKNWPTKGNAQVSLD